MKCYQPEVYFAREVEDKNNEEFVEVITLSLTRGAAFLVTIAGISCNALINTGAMQSCISETFYNQLMLLQLLKVFHLSGTSASGSTLIPMGIIHLFKLGGHSFEFNFIVCRNLTRPVILGHDFIQKYQIGLGLFDTRKGLLTLEDKM